MNTMNMRSMARTIVLCLIVCAACVPLAVAQTQTGTVEGKVVDQRLGPWVGKHTPHLFRQHIGLAETLLDGEIQQLFVRNAAPNKERKAGRQFQIA